MPETRLQSCKTARNTRGKRKMGKRKKRWPKGMRPKLHHGGVINPHASCSDSSFNTILKKEIPRIKSLVEAEELEFYLLFTNRRLTGDAEKKIVEDRIKQVDGVQNAWLLAKDNIIAYLKRYKHIWVDLGFNRYNNPLRIHPEDIGEVITDFYDMRNGIAPKFDSKKDFKHPGISEKNEDK
jgi:hypothetical protein